MANLPLRDDARPPESVAAAGDWLRGSRAPILLCFGYAFAIFHVKAAAHWATGIPHIDFVEPVIPEALLLITVSLLPVFLLLMINPVLRATSVEPASPRGLGAAVFASVALSLGLAAIVFAARGAAALQDLYGNRLYVEHGPLALLTIVASPLIIATIVALAYSSRRFSGITTLLLCSIWGVFLAKGFMLAYPLMAYLGIKSVRNRWPVLPLFVVGVAGIVAVVVLGRLRSGVAPSELLQDEGLRFLLLLMLHRIDQLDSFALTLERPQLAFSDPLSTEILQSASYLLPRGLLADKPLSFSLEMTSLFRPEVFAGDAANNFTLFAQTYLIAGVLGPILAIALLLGFFVTAGLLQRWLFPTNIGLWVFSLALLVPCFMSLLSAGAFREYVLLQVPLSLAGLLAFKALRSLGSR